MKYRCVSVAALILTFSGSAAGQQHVLLDKEVRAGELHLFRDLNDEKAYYYVVDQVKLATDGNGRPRFSFLRYVENKPGDESAEAAREGEGGGILHAVVSLSVTREQLQAAERELQRQVPGARIKGPVAFKSGTFALVSIFKEAASGLGAQVICTGKAPILDGQQVAVSVQLSKLGSKVLWQSFHTAAPAIQFAFDMQADGYNSPKIGRIEANWDEIYRHKAFTAGAKSKYLEADINAAFDDLVRSGAIKVTDVGADSDMQQMLKDAYDQIKQQMFDEASQPAVPAAAEESVLDRARTVFEKNETAAITERDKVRTDNETARNHNAELEKRQRAADDAERDARDKRERADEARAHVESLGKQVAEARSELAKANRAHEGDQQSADGNQQAAEGDQQVAEASQQAPEGNRQAQELSALEEHANKLETELGEAEAAAKKMEDSADGAESAAAAARGNAPTESEYLPVREEPSAGGGVALVATFEMKKTRQSGRYSVDLNKFTTDTKNLPFEANIGDLRAFINDPAHFRHVNLDDPLYRQREIAVFVDGLNAEDFGQYINFVTVQMRKRHAGGDLTLEEVRIDRRNFNQQGNRFALLYGWKNDKALDRWFEYEYRLVWSFFGGISVEGPWKSSTAEALHAAPPIQRTNVEVQGDPEAIQKAGVRAVTVRVFYTLAGVEKVKTVTLNAMKNQLSEKIEFMLPEGSPEYAYEIIWQLTGNRTVSSGRRLASTAVLFIDDIPAS